MNSEIWDLLEKCAESAVTCVNTYATEIPVHTLPFNSVTSINRSWTNDYISRAHLNIIDARTTKKLWMMHLCIFPSHTNNSPIFGFDVIAGANKVTGLFLDVSPGSAGANHLVSSQYYSLVKNTSVSKERVLPEWAKNIFSDRIIAAGNIQNIAEVSLLIHLMLKVLNQYLTSIQMFNNTELSETVIKKHNFYCHNQKQNPKTPAVLKKLGFSDNELEYFSENVLFPQI